MPPTTAARWMIRSGRACWSTRTMSASFRRSYSRLRGTNGAGHPRRTRASTTTEPRKPPPPVTTTRLSLQKSAMRLGAIPGAAALEVGVDHHPHQLGESHLGRPPELFLGLGGVTEQNVDLGGPYEERIDHDVLAPIER